LTLLAISACALIVYSIVTAIYRLYFHSLAKFPGPKIPALTLWYEFYYDVIKRGCHIWKIEEMHKRYGIALCSGQTLSFDSFDLSAPALLLSKAYHPVLLPI
jgi:hypothetical protein